MFLLVISQEKGATCLICPRYEKDDILLCVLEGFEVPHESSVLLGTQTMMVLIFHHVVFADL